MASRTDSTARKAAPKLGGRAIKREVFAILQSDDFQQSLSELAQWPARQVVNPLLSSLLNADEQIKWRGVTALGEVVSRLADQDMESARVVMRRLIWMLNDESGGIGWGVPETMGEIMARHEGLAREYVCMLISYVNEDGNFLELEPLQRGAVWAIGRLAQVRPSMVQEAGTHLLSFLGSSDPVLRGITVWTLGLLGTGAARPHLEGLTRDDTEMTLYLNGVPAAHTVGELAKEALAAIEEQ